jgi:hypothetical protein
LIEAFVAVLQVGDEFFTHAAGPVTFDVIGDGGYRILALRLGAKEVADVVRHVDQVLWAAHAPIIGFGLGAHGLSKAATRPEVRPTARL